MPDKETIHQLKSRKIIEKQLNLTLEKGLPPTIRLIAYNYSRAGTSLYALLHRKIKANPSEWLTLRLADHPLWLKEAQQLSLDFGNPVDLRGLANKIHQLFMRSEVDHYFYVLSLQEVAVLQFLDECQKRGLIWAIHLPEEIFAARKQVPLDLNSDFMEAELFLGNRNNLNHLMLPVESKEFQTELAVLFGRNLLFSQFSRGHMLRLLPTNQWIQPIINQASENSNNWEKRMVNGYGQRLMDVYEEAKNR